MRFSLYILLLLSIAACASAQQFADSIIIASPKLSNKVNIEAKPLANDTLPPVYNIFNSPAPAIALQEMPSTTAKRINDIYVGIGNLQHLELGFNRQINFTKSALLVQGAYQSMNARPFAQQHRAGRIGFNYVQKGQRFIQQHNLTYSNLRHYAYGGELPLSHQNLDTLRIGTQAAVWQASVYSTNSNLIGKQNPIKITAAYNSQLSNTEFYTNIGTALRLSSGKSSSVFLETDIQLKTLSTEASNSLNTNFYVGVAPRYTAQVSPKNKIDLATVVFLNNRGVGILPQAQLSFDVPNFSNSLKAQALLFARSNYDINAANNVLSWMPQYLIRNILAPSQYIRYGTGVQCDINEKFYVQLSEAYVRSRNFLSLVAKPSSKYSVVRGAYNISDWQLAQFGELKLEAHYQASDKNHITLNAIQRQFLADDSLSNVPRSIIEGVYVQHLNKKWWFKGITILRSGMHYRDNIGAWQKVPTYIDLGFTLNKQMSKKATASVQFANLLGQQNQIINGYNAYPISGLLSLQYRFL